MSKRTRPGLSSRVRRALRDFDTEKTKRFRALGRLSKERLGATIHAAYAGWPSERFLDLLNSTDIRERLHEAVVRDPAEDPVGRAWMTSILGSHGLMVAVMKRGRWDEPRMVRAVGTAVHLIGEEADTWRARPRRPRSARARHPPGRHGPPGARGRGAVGRPHPRR